MAELQRPRRRQQTGEQRRCCSTSLLDFALRVSLRCFIVLFGHPKNTQRTHIQHQQPLMLKYICIHSPWAKHRAVCQRCQSQAATEVHYGIGSRSGWNLRIGTLYCSVSVCLSIQLIQRRDAVNTVFGYPRQLHSIYVIWHTSKKHIQTHNKWFRVRSNQSRFLTIDASSLKNYSSSLNHYQNQIHWILLSCHLAAGIDTLLNINYFPQNSSIHVSSIWHDTLPISSSSLICPSLHVLCVARHSKINRIKCEVIFFVLLIIHINISAYIYICTYITHSIYNQLGHCETRQNTVRCKMKTIFKPSGYHSYD